MERKCARVVRSAAWLLVVVALAAPAPALAGDADRARRAQDVWDAYSVGSAERTSAPSSADAGPAAPATSPSDDVERLALASILALIAGGITTRLVSTPRPLARIASSAATGPVRPIAPARSVHPTGAAPAEQPPRRPLGAAPRSVRSPGPPAPPEPERAWTAEIDWRLVDGAARFRVAARPADAAAEPIALRESPLLEWPPGAPRSVQALTDAVEALESALVAAGWTPEPSGSAWYAKRFTWQPGARPRAVPAGPARRPGAVRG